ncbi:hypothetical protein Tco_0094890 [Tanacetum coccineum]
MYHQKNVDYVELLWEDFTYQIDNKVYKKQENMYCHRFTIVIIHHFVTSKDDYLINTLRFVSRREASQKYRVVLPECLTSPEMKESKAYKTYLSYATVAVPPKKSKRVKRAAKKSSTTPAAGIVIREPTAKTKSKRKEKEKVDIAHDKGIELLSDVALTEEAQIKEVKKEELKRLS